MYTKKDCEDLGKCWKDNPRWKGIVRPYKPEDVVRLRGTVQIDYTLAKMGAEKLWKMLEDEKFVRALGAMTGSQAVQMVQAGLKAIYLSGWQVAGDMNDNLHTYPDQSLYTWMSVPHLIRRFNNAFIRADQIQHMNNGEHIDYFIPIIADAEAGFGGNLNAFELTKAMIEAGAAAIHLEDQQSNFKKCGHMGGKVLVPVSEFIQKLITARLAADVLGVPTVIIGRTDAESATYNLSDADPVDREFMTGERAHEGYYHVKNGTDYAIARARAFAPYCDLVWCETSTPDLGEAKAFAQGVHEKYPHKWLAYNCSPSFNWKRHLDDKEIMHFQNKLADMGYKFQFVTLAGFHAINATMFELAHDYSKRGMAAYADFQEKEFDLEKQSGYKAVKHQSFVGAGYFDEVQMTILGKEPSTKAMKGSTEEAQFHGDKKKVKSAT
jgi:isocitrate lyase